MREGEVHTPGSAAARIFAANERLNQMLIEGLDPGAWRARAPGGAAGRVRTIAAIFTHIHNVRAKWVRLTAPHLGVPALLNRAVCTPEGAAAGLAESAARCGEMLEAALGGDGRIETFKRDGWARPWQAGPEMLVYMVSHEAHHRGQVCMLAHQLGYGLTAEVGSGLWNWEKVWKEFGWRGGPGG